MSNYQQMIVAILDREGVRYIDPRHVEAWMRVENPTLDNLSPKQFAVEVKMALTCINAATRAQSEALAQSEGL